MNSVAVFIRKGVMGNLLKIRWSRVLGAVLAAGLLVSPSLAQDSASVLSKLQASERGRPAPDFVLPALDGSRMGLKALRGKVVFLNFWATWCLPCRHEMPAMEKLYGRFKGADFEIVAISIDSKGKEAVASFVKELKLTYPILLDRDMAVMRRFGVLGLPTTYLIDRKGNIAETAVGPREWAGKEALDRVGRLIAKGRSK